MLSLTSFTQHVAHKLSTFDRAIVKLALICMGLLLAKLFPVLISYHRGYYLGLIILCELYLVRKIFGQKK